MQRTRQRIIVFFFALCATMLSLSGCSADGLSGPDLDSVLEEVEAGSTGDGSSSPRPGPNDPPPSGGN